MNRNPLVRLEEILKEKSERRTSYINILINSIPQVKENAKKWFQYEMITAKEEVNLLEELIPDETKKWKTSLKRIQIKFDSSLTQIDKIVEKVSYGEIQRMEDVYKPSEKGFPDFLDIVPEKEKPLDIASAILSMIDAASDLEKINKEIDSEARKLLVLRKIVLLEKNQLKID